MMFPAVLQLMPWNSSKHPGHRVCFQAEPRLSALPLHVATTLSNNNDNNNTHRTHYCVNQCVQNSAR